MNWKSHLSGSKGRGQVGGVLVALVGLSGSLIQGFSDRSYDLLFRFRPPIDVSRENAVIVDMDDESGEFLGEPSNLAWSRKTHARLIQQLTLHQAGVVAFDVLFRDPTTNDLALLSAATNHGKVFFGARCETQTTPTREAILRVRRPFGESVDMEKVGLVEDSSTEDRFIRQHQTTRLKVPSLAWRIADLYVDGLANAPASRWFNYYGPAGTVPHTSYWRVISNSLPPSISMTNKVVYVGARATIGPTGGTGTDYLPTPCDKLTPGVEINATAYLNLVRGDWLTRLPPAAERVLLVVFGLFGGYGLSRLQPLQAAGAGLLAAAGVLGSAILLFVGQMHFWFPWLIVVAAQIPAAVAWSVLSYSAALRSETPAPADALATVPAGGGPDATVVQPALPLSVPAIPDHTLLRCIGKGAYGEVWLARDVLGCYHAVKIVHRRSFPVLGPYEREFKGVQKYTPISRSHPGWVHILHVGRNDEAGYFFSIMEVGDDQTTGQQIDPTTYVPRNLSRDKERRGRFPLDECLQLGLALSAALEHLHQHLLIHRDIKPSNVIFVGGAPKFADIGLVTELQSTPGDVSFLGTEGYIAPEGPGTAAADVYSLGKLLYEISMGRDRLEFPELPTTMLEKVTEPIWRELNEILLKACAPAPSRRYRTAAELHGDLLKLQSKLTSQIQARASERS